MQGEGLAGRRGRSGVKWCWNYPYKLYLPPYFIKENRIKDYFVFDFKVMDSFQQVLSMVLEGFKKQ